MLLVAVSIYHVSSNCSHSESLEHYLNNTNKYFTSKCQLILKPGKYFLNADLVIQHVSDFSLIGESFCKITCVPHVSIRIFNVKNFKLENITFVNCGKNHSNHLHTTFDYDYVSISKPSHNASILLYNCTSVVINNVSVLVNAGTTGIFVVNVNNYSMLTNVIVTVNYTICPTRDEHPEQINGISFYFDDDNNKITNMQLENFQFIANGSCAHPLQYAISLLLLQKSTNISFTIENTNFCNLFNVSSLYYFGETCGTSVTNNLRITNCVIAI